MVGMSMGLEPVELEPEPIDPRTEFSRKVGTDNRPRTKNSQTQEPKPEPAVLVPVRFFLVPGFDLVLGFDPAKRNGMTFCGRSSHVAIKGTRSPNYADRSKKHSPPTFAKLRNHIGGSSSQTHEIGDVYLTAEELHQLHLDEEALRETLEQKIDEKAQEEKIRQKQADDDEYFMEFGKVVEDVGEDADFNSGAWVSATNYVNAFGGTVTGLPTIHYKVLDVGSYGNDITVRVAMILANVLVFTIKPSKHYLNITKRNVVEVFRKDTVSLV
nr:hypothetical protein [Tanacetum cinerariifolium]